MTVDAMMSALPGLWLALGIASFLAIVVRSFDPGAKDAHDRHGRLPFDAEDEIDG